MPEQIPYFPEVLTWLAHHFGVRVTWADWDCKELAIEARDISAADLRCALERYQKPMRDHLHWERERRMRVFVGGPLNGQRYGLWKQAGATIAKHIARAKWAAYEVGKDGRAWFRGFATSHLKARRLQLVRSPEVGK